ncbi:MAG: TolC family protein [Phycisphaerae bacterium]|nr:TolC family protein [Phycisphaerae bacterium]NUQ46002.1 TolC family protein [Phycisphaerae bacterium]
MTRLTCRRTALVVALVSGGCASPHTPTAPPPDVRPATQPAMASALPLDRSAIRPIDREIVAVDLPAVVQVARARNVDIEQARERVTASRGRLESTIGAIFPVLTPGAQFEQVHGKARNTDGNLLSVGFNTFQVSAAVQAVINPPRVAYDVIAARKRLAAAEHEERAVGLETLRRAANAYYELVFAQARVAAAHQSLREAEEFLRVSRLRELAGAAVPADVLRAESRQAERAQDVIAALNAYDGASIALAVIVRMDAAVTLAPQIEKLTPLALVRPELTLDELLSVAVDYRPELVQVRTLIQAAEAERKAAWWGAFGPQFQVGYQYGGITGHANNVIPRSGTPANLVLNPFAADGSFSANPYVNNAIKNAISRDSQRRAGARDQTFGFSDQHRFGAGTGWRFSFAALGDLRTAGALQRQAIIEGERLLDRARADVVAARQSSRANEELIGLAHSQLMAAEESLRLAQAAFQAGVSTTLDVLQAQDAVAQARLRHAAALVRFNQSQVDLLAAIGLLNEESLAAPTSEARPGESD